MLTPLQEQVAQIIAGLDEAKGFALAGGAALIATGLVVHHVQVNPGFARLIVESADIEPNSIWRRTRGSFRLSRVAPLRCSPERSSP